MPNVHTTPLDALEIHESGYVELGSTGFEISALPVMDARFPHMMARLGHGDEIEGTRLPTTTELDALHKLSLHIEPVTLPTPAMRVEAGIVNSEAAINAFRNANMRSFDWCEIHDDEVARRLEAAGWDGMQPVVNWGKAWTVGGGIYGWWRRGKPMIQTLSYFHKGEPRYTDYATKRHAVRAVGSSGGPPIRRRRALVGVVDAIGKAGAVLGDALELAGRVVGIGGAGAPTPASKQAEPAGAPKMAPTPSGTYPFIKARNFRAGRRATISLVVLHSMEAIEAKTTAENVAKWFAGPHAPMASAHFCCDADSIVQCVHLDDEAFAAPGTNECGIQVEMAGYARQTATDWDDAYSREMLERVSSLVAELCTEHEIPPAFVDADGLLAGARGVTTHAEVTKACLAANKRGIVSSPFYNRKDPRRPRTDHVDPGPNFPIAAFMDAVRSKVLPAEAIYD